jgi:hypothetical protein
MKQTAVEWLYETIDNELIDFLESRIDVNELSVRMLNAKQQAKAMEKEQMNEIHLDGIEQGYNMRYQQEKQKNN